MNLEIVVGREESDGGVDIGIVKYGIGYRI